MKIQIIIPSKLTCKIVSLLSNESPDPRGFCFRISSLPFSIPIAMAGKESVIKLINSKWTGKKGVGKIANDVTRTQIIADKFPDKR